MVVASAATSDVDSTAASVVASDSASDPFSVKVKIAIIDENR